MWKEILENNHWVPPLYLSLMTRLDVRHQSLTFIKLPCHHVIDSGTWDVNSAVEFLFFFPLFLHSYLKLYFVFPDYNTIGTLAVYTKKIPGFFHTSYPTAQSLDESLGSPFLCMRAQSQHIPGGRECHFDISLERGHQV